MTSMPRTRSAAAALGLALALALDGCGEAGEPPPPPSPPPTAPPPAPPTPTEPSPPSGSSDVARGAANYAAYCASCHGARGEGDGPVAAALDPRPAKHSDGTYMNALSDEHLFRVIKEGGPAVGKSPLMAPWSGTLSDAQIRDVMAFIRSLADPPYSP